ncbi:MAG: hypothetical protein ACTIJJ_11650 [Galactobacter sp.]
MKSAARKLAKKALPTVRRVAGESAKKSTPKPKVVVAGPDPVDLSDLAKALGVGADSSLDDLVQAAGKRMVEGQLVRRLAAGASPERSWATVARSLISIKETQRALSLGHSLRRSPETEVAGRIVVALAVAVSSTPDVAWDAFAPLRGTDAVVQVAGEYYAAFLPTAPEQALQDISNDIEQGLHRSWSAASLLSVAENSASMGGETQATNLLDELDSRPARELDARIRNRKKKARGWLPGGKRRGPIETVPQTINFGVLSYFQPDFESRNIGDSIQTVASLGHLRRHTGFKYTGNDDLVKFMDQLSKRLKPERVVDSPEATFNLIDIFRDGTVYQQIPEKTWAITFGWYMHRTYVKGYNLPFHENILPIPVSMFFRYTDTITDEAADYLRKIGPIGCRDWQSVAMLTAAGVPAFFSGCITTTIDTVFARQGQDKREGRIFVDSPQTASGDFRVQLDNKMRQRGVLANLQMGYNWVSDYADKYRDVVTSRLHCYLPARSVGANVTFLPKNPSDNRFGGLYGIDDQAYDKIRQGILTKLDAVLKLIASGAETEEVYALWREITADDVEASRKHMESFGTFADLAADEDAPAQLPAVASGALRVVVDAPEAEHRGLKTLISSATAATAAPIDWVIATASEPSDSVRTAVESAAGSASVTWSAAKNSQDATLLAAIESACDERVVVLAAAGRVDQDLADLVSQLEPGHVIAAANERRRGQEDGHQKLRMLSTAQRDDVPTALEIVYKASASYPWKEPWFTSGVLVLDAAALKADGSLRAARAMVNRYKASSEEALNAVTGGRRTTLPNEWNFQPRQQLVDNAKIITWRPGAKPWDKAHYVPGQDR